MINEHNVIDVIRQNKILLPSILNRVEDTKEQGLAFRYKTIEAIKGFLIKQTQVLLSPSNENDFGGLVTYRDGRFSIHINTELPKIYENFIWAQAYYYFTYEAEAIKNSPSGTVICDIELNEKESAANLFATELLVDSRVLKAFYNDILSINPHDTLENNIVRLLPAFEVPYKVIVVKLALDGLISEQEAVNIIDYNYGDKLPNDFDLSVLYASMAFLN